MNNLFFPQSGSPSKSEAEIAVSALRLNTLSKLTFGDSIRFDSLVRDVFSGVEFQSAGYERLKEALRGAAKDMGLNVNENQVGYLNFPLKKSKRVSFPNKTLKCASN